VGKILKGVKMSEEFLAKIIVIIFVLVFLIIDWKDIWLRGGD